MRVDELLKEFRRWRSYETRNTYLSRMVNLEVLLLLQESAVLHERDKK